MAVSDADLWRKIADWPLPFRSEHDALAEPPRDCTRFEHNLRKAGDWTDETAVRITAIYRQFLYLKALSGEPVTPSTCIDAAWHLHLEFKEDCAALSHAVGRDIPPLVDLSYAEHQSAYDRGRLLYEAEFHSVPARDLWPSGQDQTNAEWLWLMQLGGGLAAMFFVLVGVMTGAWVMAVPVLVILVVDMHFAKKWSGASPPQMSRCG